MCGILGVTQQNEQEVNAALKTLGHRGPDGSGVVADNEVTFGHARLSIIDLSEAASQPMSTPDGRFHITYNGEIYNYRELRENLEQAGYTFLTKSDTEVMLAGYAQEGPSFLNKLRGMWACGIYDKQRSTLVISRDSFGIKPLYYSHLGGSLFFASEVRALMALGVSSEPNPEAFTAYFNLGYFIAPDTCYRDIRMLMPGEVVTYDLRTRKLKSEFIANDDGRAPTASQDEVEVVSGLDQVLRESVDAHYVSDVPVGILFSGGNDSALIAALSRATGHTPEAYHLAIEGSTDTDYAQAIASSLGIKTSIVSLTTQELVEQYEAIWDQLDVPFADTSIIPTSLIYKKIRNQTKVVLSGEGGDELFGGYQRHARMLHHAQIRQDNSVLTALDALYQTGNFAFRYRNPIVRRARQAYFSHGDDVIAVYLAETKNIDYPLKQNKLRALLYNQYTQVDSSPQSPALFFDRHMYLPNNLLFKTDTASMASSIEARVPLVDTRVWQYVRQSVHPGLCFSSQYMGKYLLKKVLEQYLPKELIYRDKKGFSFSFTRYHIPQFADDVRKAILFHRAHADMFGLTQYKNLLNEKHADVFISKFPRFAFALVSNWRVFR